MYPGYDTKQSDDEASIIRETWGIQSIPSLPGSLGPGVTALDRVLMRDQIELFDI